MHWFKIVSILFVLTINCESSPRRNNLVRDSGTYRYRLTGNAIPKSYNLELRLEDNFATTNQFSGIVTITFSLINTTTFFDLHAKDLEITNFTLTKNNIDLEVLPISEPNPVTDIIYINSTKNMEPNEEYVLKIWYNGTLNDSTMVGFYKSSYFDEFKTQKFLAATQFEETHARTAFPCFDEPEWKAVFTISITYPEGYYALSNEEASSEPIADNTNSNLSTVTFGTTPLLSTYLVAFIVADKSDFQCKNANPTTYNNIVPQVCSRFGSSENDTRSQVALGAVSALWNILSDYVRYNISVDHLQMFLAALPDFSPGAMENFGLITFKESYLLWDENDSNYDQQNVITTIAHELSHQWFGDLVTLKWWNDVFLNEGFATYFEYHAAALYKKNWELEKQFVIEQLQTALLTDAKNTALPLSYDVENADYSSRFDDISYNKGGSILRMVAHFVGEDVFKETLGVYLNNNEFNNTIAETLWQTFYLTEEYPTSVETIMKNWTYKPGYPVVTVSTVGQNITFRQEQFFSSGNTNETTEWYIPITYTLSSDPNFANTTTKVWLEPGKTTTITQNVEWIILNNQQVGYYRVQYDNTLWSEITNVLKTNMSMISEINRAQIIDDQFNFAKAGQVDYKDLLSFLTILKNDSSYYSWYAAFNGFDYLLHRVENKDIQNALSEFILQQMSQLNKSVSIDLDLPDNQIDTLKQVMTLNWACRLGEERCINTTKTMFADYQKTNTINRNLKSVVFCNALRYSDSIVEDFRFLWLKYLSSDISSERVTILKALGCANNELSRRNYLKNILTKDVRRQDASYGFASVYTNNPEGVLEVLTFIYDNYKEMTTHFGRPSIISSTINSAAEYITNQKQLNRLKTITELEDLEDNIKTTATQALARAKTSLDSTEKIENIFKEYFNIKSSGSTVKYSLSLLTAVLLWLGISLY